MVPAGETRGESGDVSPAVDVTVLGRVLVAVHGHDLLLKAELLDELERVGAGHAGRPQRPRAVLVVGAVAVPEDGENTGLLIR